MRRNSRTEHIEKSSKRLVSGFGKEKVRGNGYSQEKKNVLGADQTEKSERSSRESQETKACLENDPTQPTERDKERSRSLLERIQLQQSTESAKKDAMAQKAIEHSRDSDDEDDLWTLVTKTKPTGKNP